MRFRSILLGFLATLLLVGCTAPNQPDLAALTPTRLLSFSPDGRYIVYFAEEQGRDIGGFQIPGWYVLHDLFTGKNYPLHGEGSWYRNAVVWLKNGNVGLDLDSSVIIANTKGEVQRRLKVERDLWYALSPTGELLVTEGDYKEPHRYLWNPETNERKEIQITWDGSEKMGSIIQTVFSPMGDRFAAIAGNSLAVFTLQGERGGTVPVEGKPLVTFQFEGTFHPYFETDAPCMLSWGNEGTAINIPCQKSEVYFDLLQQKVVRPESGKTLSYYGLVAPDNVRVAVIENGTIVVKHKSEF